MASQQLVIQVSPQAVSYGIFSDEEPTLLKSIFFPELRLQTKLLDVIKMIEADWSESERLKLISSIPVEGPKMLGGLPVERIDYAEAWGRGGLRFSRSKKALVVDLNYSTRMMVADRKSKLYQQVILSGLGGGTLEGLGRLLCQVENAHQLDSLAQGGQADQLHLGFSHTEVDVVSDFGRVMQNQFHTQSDMAAGIIAFVVKNLGQLAETAAGSYGLTEIVWGGELFQRPLVVRQLQERAGELDIMAEDPLSLGLYGAARMSK